MAIEFDTVIEIDLGDQVLCDGCGIDLSQDPRSGGFLFGSYAYGPCCADNMLQRIKDYNEQRFIKAFCTPGMSFPAWVRHLRKRRGGR